MKHNLGEPITLTRELNERFRNVLWAVHWDSSRPGIWSLPNSLILGLRGTFMRNIGDQIREAHAA